MNFNDCIRYKYTINVKGVLCVSLVLSQLVILAAYMVL